MEKYTYYSSKKNNSKQFDINKIKRSNLIAYRKIEINILEINKLVNNIEYEFKKRL